MTYQKHHYVKVCQFRFLQTSPPIAQNAATYIRDLSTDKGAQFEKLVSNNEMEENSKTRCTLCSIRKNLGTLLIRFTRAFFRKGVKKSP